MSKKVFRSAVVVTVVTTLAACLFIFLKLQVAQENAENAQGPVRKIRPFAADSEKARPVKSLVGGGQLQRRAGERAESSGPVLVAGGADVPGGSDAEVDGAVVADAEGNPTAASPTDKGSALQPRFAAARMAPEKMSWEPQVADYGSVRLTVTGPGIQPFDATFSEGEKIEFPLQSGDGTVWADGLYSWELVAAPKVSEETRAIMNEVREVTTADNAEEILRYNDVYIPRGQSQTGSFRIVDGKPMEVTEDVVSRQAEAEALELANAGAVSDFDSPDGVQLRDIVHNDDVIIGFSNCVGNDCVNGENFGFDTLRLKENNLRIHFQDTSNSGSFPSNDWRIIVNDSANGGGNYFGVEDSTAGRMPFRVDAGAPADALRVDSAGDVGLGTSNPVVELHVADGDSPTVRLEQNGSSGFTPQTWDLAGNEANFFIRDVTNGSQLPFRIKPGADTDALFIAADSDIGIGTDSPDARLHIDRNDDAEPSLLVNDKQTGGADFIVAADGDIGVGTENPLVKLHVKASEVRIDNTGSANAGFLRFLNDSGSFSVGMSGGAANALLFFDRGLGHVAATYRGGASGSWSWNTNGVQRMTLDQDGNLTTTGMVNGVSDRAAKKDIKLVDVGSILEKVADLPISEWSYKTDEQNLRHIGPMAQDFKKQFGLGEDEKTIALADASGVALAAIKGLHHIVEARDLEIQALREKTEAMEAQLQILMERIGAPREE